MSYIFNESYTFNASCTFNERYTFHERCTFNESYTFNESCTFNESYTDVPVCKAAVYESKPAPSHVLLLDLVHFNDW